jgi:hypothetical protein
MPPKKARTRLSTLGETPAKSGTGGGGSGDGGGDSTDVKIVSANANSGGVEPVQAAAVADILHESPTDSVLKYASNPDELAFLSSLSSIERNVCLIAQEHLQTSFDLARSNGYIAWKKDNKK